MLVKKLSDLILGSSISHVAKFLGIFTPFMVTFTKEVLYDKPPLPLNCPRDLCDFCLVETVESFKISWRVG